MSLSLRLSKMSRDIKINQRYTNVSPTGDRRKRDIERS